MKAWSEIYCGITHYGSCDDYRRSSINIFNTKAQLVRWWRGCGFSPDTEWFDSLDEAKAAGEAWANGK